MKQKLQRWLLTKTFMITMLIVLVNVIASTTIAVKDGFSKDYGNIDNAVVVSIYDGDTFDVNLPTLPSIFGKSIPVRVLGIDTPEKHGQCIEEIILADHARNFVVMKLKIGSTITLHNVQRDKYFRILANVTLPDGSDLADQLVSAGLARPYDGGAKTSWCQSVISPNLTFDDKADSVGTSK